MSDARFLLAGVLASLILGCGGDSGSPSSPTQPSPSSAAISVAITPSEVVARLQSPLRAEWSVAVTETAGVGGNVDFVTARIRDSEDVSSE